MLSQIININETLKELEHLGLVIDDKNTFEYYVKNFNINTFIHEYSDYFLNENGRYENTKSSELIEFYTFDKNLGIHLFKNILIIEKIINTNLAYILINQFNIKDKCLLRLDKYFIKEKVLPNVSTIEPQISFEILLIKMVKYLGANKNYRKFQDHSTGDPILQ
jgi:abortive infection bacteriophage resistance protein